MRTKVLFWATAVAFATLLQGCKNPPTKEKSPSATESATESSVVIHFVRGHNAHKLVASLRGGAAMAQSFLDRQVLAESTVDRAHYLNFLTQASEFLKTPRGAASERSPCRTPFTVTVRIGEETRAASGCVGSDEGALSHLVRDGEFLLHQGSGMRIK